VPLLIGGATTSAMHHGGQDRPAISRPGGVRQGRFAGGGVAQNLVSAETKADYIAKNQG